MCYGQGGNPTMDADALAAAVSTAVHAIGPRISAGGVGVWNSWDDAGEGAVKDPNTDQPHADLIIAVDAATLPIA
jgi:hypothetical protein